MARRSTFRTSCTGCASGCGQCSGTGGASGSIGGISDIPGLEERLQADLARTLRVPAGESVSPLPDAAGRANSLAGFDSEGEAIVYALGEGGILAGPPGPRGPRGKGLVVGTVMPWFNNTLPSNRWFWLNGTEFIAADYPALAAHLGTVGGEPSSPDKCKLPDTCGRGLYGKDDMGGIAPKGRITQAVSKIIGTLLGAFGGDQRIHKHNHPITDLGHEHTGNTEYSGNHAHSYMRLLNGSWNGVNNDLGLGTSGSNLPDATGQDGNHFHTFTTSKTPTGIQLADAGQGESQNMSPTIICNWIIYAGESDDEVETPPVIEITDVTGLEDKLKIFTSSAYVPGLVNDGTDPILFSIPITTKNSFTIKAGAPGCAAVAESAATGITVVTIEDGLDSLGTITWGVGDTEGTWDVPVDFDFTPGLKLVFRRSLPWDDTLDRIGITVAGERIFP